MATKIPQCSGCGGSGHYAINCLVTARTVPKAKKRYIKPESGKNRERRLKARELWFEQNPPETPDGKWFCYLDGLSEYNCWGTMSREEIEQHGLEHVIAKVKDPSLKFEVANLRVACPPCNRLKGSWRLDQLLAAYEHWSGPRA